MINIGRRIWCNIFDIFVFPVQYIYNIFPTFSISKFRPFRKFVWMLFQLNRVFLETLFSKSVDTNSRKVMNRFCSNLAGFFEITLSSAWTKDWLIFISITTYVTRQLIENILLFIWIFVGPKIQVSILFLLSFRHKFFSKYCWNLSLYGYNVSFWIYKKNCEN